MTEDTATGLVTTEVPTRQPGWTRETVHLHGELLGYLTSQHLTASSMTGTGMGGGPSTRHFVTDAGWRRVGDVDHYTDRAEALDALVRSRQ